MADTIDWLNGSLKSAEHEVFRDVVSVSGQVEPMADGQVVIISDINRVNLTLETSKGDKRTLKAVAKFEPASSVGKEFANITGVFETETMMYGDVLKTMGSIMENVGDKNFLWPECYHTSDQKLLLQDLCESGYSIVPAHKCLDLEHSLMAMNAVGKYHALTMIMKERAILDLTRFKPFYLGLKLPFIINLHKMTIGGLIQAINASWGSEWSSVPERLAKFIDSTGDVLANSIERTKDTWDVLCHGDLTIRNMLFHYPSGSTKPDGIKFVDFQMCHYNNLGLDLASLLYSSLMPQLREDNMDKLLATYTDSLAATCKQHGYKGAVPKPTDVAESLKSLSYLTTITSLMCIPFFFATGKDDAQQEANDVVEKLNKEDAGDYKLSDDDLACYANSKVMQALQYELKRCTKENII